MTTGHRAGRSIMDLEAIINAAADDADGFLAGVGSMTEARPAIRDYLKENYPKLGPVEVQRVTAGLLALLDDEGFFEAAGGGDAWSEETGEPG
jgi:hypothetical protein